MLGILNYLAAPFGSVEDLLLTSGVNGLDYTLDAKGNPVLTKQANSDANYTPWKYVTQHPCGHLHAGYSQLREDALRCRAHAHSL